MCAAPGYWDSQHWFLVVVVASLLGTVFFSLYYLCLAEPLNKLQVNWLMVVSVPHHCALTRSHAIERQNANTFLGSFQHFPIPNPRILVKQATKINLIQRI